MKLSTRGVAWLAPYVWMVGSSAPVAAQDTSQQAGEIASLMGPLLSSASTRALGRVFARYESDFVKYDDGYTDSYGNVIKGQWASCGPRWDCINYYDRAMIYYVWWQRTGKSKYLTRANQVALNFRQQYLESVKYSIVSHWAMTDGVALHYLVTGDLQSLLAIERLGEMSNYDVHRVTGQQYDIFAANWQDDRTIAYIIKALLAAYKLNAPSDGQNAYGWPAVPSWADALRYALNRTLTQAPNGPLSPDGQWRGAHCANVENGPITFHTTHPFTIGLLYDALIRYYELFEKDPRILPAIKASADILWRDDWLPANQAFKYLGQGCWGEGAADPAPDLNNLIVNGFAWIYKMTGDVTYKQRADAMFATPVNGDSPSSGPKWFNQSYTSSYRYLSWR